MLARAPTRIALAKEVGRVPSTTIPLDHTEEVRFQRLTEEIVMIDLHQHPMVLPDDLKDVIDYFRSNQYTWAYEAVRHGGWTAVATSNQLSCLGKTGPEASYAAFSDVTDEIALMFAHMSARAETVVKIERTADILEAKQSGRLGFLPTVEHLAVGHELHRVDVLYGLGVRIAGLTYSRRNFIGDGQMERTDCGLTEFGLEVIARMNELGMVIDVSHAGKRTALDAIQHSRVPVVFSHNAAHALRPTERSRTDEELLACARRGGLICITAVPNALSDDPKQDINCVLDHYDYMVKLVGADRVGIGTDTLIGDHVGLHAAVGGRPVREPAAPYLNGLESPADGKNIIRGLIRRGYSNSEIARIAGGNALALLRGAIG